jgi:hypothetical protein
MPDELLVILGAEVTILVFVVAMTLYARRMDVLSGRSFERSGVSPAGKRHRSPSLRRAARGLLRLLRRWRDRATFVPPVTRRPATPAADASGRPAAFSEAGRNNAGAQS